MIKLSIIIPVYNTEQYLKECIESIMAQTFMDFEAIFVDDGSTDASYEIVNEFAEFDKRIKLYHQNNAGVSAARNLGLKYANGDYVAFIDSDDTIAPDYLDQLYKCVIQYSPDIVLSGLVNVVDGCEKSRAVLEEGLFFLHTESELIHFFKIQLQTSPVAKLYRKQIIFANNIQFDTSLSFAEDKDFNLQYMQHIENAYALSYCGYFYRSVANSLSHKKYEYKYRIEHRHWRIKRLMFEKLCDCSIVGKSYLVNQLFYIVYDEMADIVYSTQSIGEMMRKWRVSIKEIDFGYLSENYNMLKQPLWMKFLLKNRFFWIIFIVLKIKRN